MIELRHLAYFQAVAELGSLAKAAASLHMTQPALGRQIAYLERSVGHQLFRRTHRGTTLTPTGARFRRQADVIFAQVERIPEILGTGYDPAPVNLGIPPGLPTSWLVGVLEHLRSQTPDTTVLLHEATSESQRVMLHSGVIDVGLIHFQPPDARSRVVLTQRFGCTVRDGSTLASSTSITLSDLDGLRVMVRSAQENPQQERRLRARADNLGVEIEWIFRSFAEYGELIADTARVDAVLVGRVSAARYFPTWTWVPFSEKDSENAYMRTWAIWALNAPPSVGPLLAAMAEASASLHHRSSQHSPAP